MIKWMHVLRENNLMTFCLLELTVTRVLELSQRSEFEDANSHYRGPVGLFGLPHVNNAGRRFMNYLATNKLVATSTYFQKRNYGT